MLLQRLREACEAYETGDEDELEALHDIRDAALAFLDHAAPAAALLTPHTQLEFTYDGVDYMTAFNAFQAQKAPPDERAKFSYLDIKQATDLGRTYPIDTAMWDSGRKNLMYKILKSQAYQHPSLEQRILQHGDADDIGSGGMGHDAFWKSALPKIWCRLHAHFSQQAHSKKVKREEGSFAAQDRDPSGRSPPSELERNVHEQLEMSLGIKLDPITKSRLKFPTTAASSSS
jgi:predicted NAD-dependent protein-ADP-ribosyltransferase YbiA (DUF1768 family)